VYADRRAASQRNGESAADNGRPAGVGPENQPPGQASRNGSAGRADTAGAGNQFLKQALALAVDAVAEAERYAGTHGISLQFTSEDVREIGLRIYADTSR
jgi:hypothetical protein